MRGILLQSHGDQVGVRERLLVIVLVHLVLDHLLLLPLLVFRLARGLVYLEVHLVLLDVHLLLLVDHRPGPAGPRRMGQHLAASRSRAFFCPLLSPFCCDLLLCHQAISRTSSYTDVYEVLCASILESLRCILGTFLWVHG